MRRAAGQATVFVLGMSLVVVGVVGVGVDVTRAFLYRRTLQNAADAGALAAAAELDRRLYYGADDVVPSQSSARVLAAQWLARRGIDAEASIQVEDGEVTVFLRGRVPATFLTLVGIEELPVAAEARAAPLPGAPD